MVSHVATWSRFSSPIPWILSVDEVDAKRLDDLAGFASVTNGNDFVVDSVGDDRGKSFEVRLRGETLKGLAEGATADGDQTAYVARRRKGDELRHDRPLTKTTEHDAVRADTEGNLDFVEIFQNR